MASAACFRCADPELGAVFSKCERSLQRVFTEQGLNSSEISTPKMLFFLDIPLLILLAGGKKGCKRAAKGEWLVSDI